MVRECAIAALALSSGCSLILDFSGDSKPAIDAPFSDAECAFKEPNDTAATAATLELTDVGPGAICPPAGGGDDHDFYKITVPTNMSLSAKITFVNSTTGDLDLKLSDAAGTMLSSSRGFDNDEQIVCPGASPPCAGPLTPGDYILEVFPAAPGAGNRYDITLSITP